MTIAQLKQERAKLVADARKILNLADAEKRSMTAEETTQYEKIMADVDAKGGDIQRREKLEQAEAWAQDSQGRRSSATEPGEAEQRGGGNGASGEESRTLITWGERYNSPREVEARGATATPEYRKAFSEFLAFGTQSRALSATSPVDGGYLVAPITMATGLLKFLDNMVFIRQKATVYPPLVQSASLGIVSLDSDPDDADWTSELGTGNEDSAMAFGKRELKPFPLAKRVKISNKLLRQVSSAESIVQNRLGYKFGVTQEKAFLTGSGSNQPLGLFTASANGISTGRDVSTDNTSTAITADGLINAKYAVKEQYQRRGEWIFHRDAVRNIRKLKDSQNQYIWQPGLAGGQPDTLLDRPINQSEYAPNTFTTGLYVGIFGDLSFYHIADALTLTIQRLVELYAATNQTGYIARLETDGMPALEEAFARVKLA